MTSKQALKEARKRWGKNAGVRAGKCSLWDKPGKDGIRACTAWHKERPCPGGLPRATVGAIVGIEFGLPYFEVKGDAGTFEEAFAEADRKDASDRERWKKIDEERKAVR